MSSIDDKFENENSSEGQVRGINATKKWANYLLESPKEFLQKMFEDWKGNPELTYEALANKYLPEEVARHSNVSKNAISRAFNMNFDKKEIKEISKEKRKVQLQKRFGGFDSKDFSKHSSRAAKSKWQNGGNYNTKGIVEGYGKVPWSDKEKKIALKNYMDDRFAKNSGSPDYEKIAKSINNKVHRGEEVRTNKSISSYIRKYKSKNNSSGSKRKPWSNSERNGVLKRSVSERFLYQEGNMKGRPDYNLIKNSINDKFHGGIETRSKSSISNYIIKYRNGNR